MPNGEVLESVSYKAIHYVLYVNALVLWSPQRLWIISFLIAVIQPCSGMNPTGNLCVRSVMIKKQEMKKEHQRITTNETGAGFNLCETFAS